MPSTEKRPRGPSLGSDNPVAALNQMHVEAEKTKNLLFNLAYADSEGTPGRSCFLYLLHEQLKSLEGMPVTPFVMGGLNGAAAIGRRKNLQFLQPGADTYPRSNKFFTIMSSGCALSAALVARACSFRAPVCPLAGRPPRRRW